MLYVNYIFIKLEEKSDSKDIMNIQLWNIDSMESVFRRIY